MTTLHHKFIRSITSSVSMKRSALIFATTTLLAGCSYEIGGSCVPGQSIPCACADGRSGVQACATNHSFAACTCSQAKVDMSHGSDTSPPAGPKRMFITRATFTGQLGGLLGADQVCNQAGTAAGLGGRWVAWLSDFNTDAIGRIADVGPWFNIRGMRVFADKAGLASLPLGEVNIDETGAYSTSAFTWTATGYDGRRLGPNCGSWTSPFASDVGQIGNPQDSQAWTEVSSPSTQPCNGRNSLYCFEQ